MPEYLAAYQAVAARVLHTACHYADVRPARSAMFGLGTLALLVLFGVVVAALL